MTTPDTFRKEQYRIISEYSGGRVGVAAVPGSGKTFTLAHLAARLVATQNLDADQEVLIVTFTNTAVDSFQARISRILKDHYQRLPFFGYRVRTLHGLAHDIVRERPALVGLADDFTILDEPTVIEIQRDIVSQHLSEWWERLNAYVNPDNVSNSKAIRYHLEQDLPTLVNNFIKRAKDIRKTPDDITSALHNAGPQFDLARFATSVYADYQRSLAYRGAVDFDDLVRLALEALDRDQGYLQRLQERWPFILEDEAQDSSRLQEDMLRLLSKNQNWVRVGDPNQAINTTFTTADPGYLIDFLDSDKNPGVIEHPLSVSGRSAPSIIALANELVRWTVEEHPVPELRNAFSYLEDRRGIIHPTAPDDPQPNPRDSRQAVIVQAAPERKIKPEQELDMITAGEEYSLVEWLAGFQDTDEPLPTVAVLVPENSRGFKLTKLLARHKIPYEQLLRSTSATREVIMQLHAILEYLSNPIDLKSLKQTFWSLMSSEKQEHVREDIDLRQTITKFFAQFRNIEDFLWPVGDFAPQLDTEHHWLVSDLEQFRIRLCRWLKASNLPIDQLILTIGQDLFTQPVDLALTYKVAVLLRGLAQSHPDWRLTEFSEELRSVSSNERKFIGFDSAATGYEPTPGRVTVVTMHAAKGLEWDRVYLMAVSNYGFPSALPQDSYIGERWYLRGSYDYGLEHINLEAEGLEQLNAILRNDPESYIEGAATLQARLDYAKERLRLLYVGITRAKRELVITWNMGRFWQKGREYENQPALPLVMLNEFSSRVNGKV